MAVNQTGNTVAAPAEPNTLRYRIARWVIAHRGLMAALFVLVTLGFAAGLPRLSIKTIFSDLLPADDPFVQVFKDHPNFGNPLTVTVMIKNTSGDIYNHETLSKVWAFTRDLDLVPGINHDSLISIATEKARYAEATPYGVDMRPIMEDSVPTDPAEIQDFRRRVEQSPNVRTFYVSRDETATLVTAAFLENLLDYGVIFEQVQALAEQYRDEHHTAIQRFGGLDIVVNNAGIETMALFTECSVEDWDRTHDVNVKGLFLGIKHAMRAMRPGAAAGNGGVIINLSSVAGLIGMPALGAYCSSKGAVRLLTKAAAAEAAKLGYGIRVNSIHPAIVKTEMGANVVKGFARLGLAPDEASADAYIESLHPIGYGRPEDIASAALFLASPASRWMTGTELVLDGGATMS